MLIDQYGISSVSENFQRRRLQPYRISVEGNTTYICFDGDEKRPIHRITKSETERVFEWAYGSWEQRANLAYIPINQVMEI